MKNTQKGFGLVAVLAVMLVVALVGAAGWYVLRKNTPQAAKTTVQTPVAPKADKPKEEKPAKAEVLHPEGWVYYKYPDSLLSFYHPPTWKSDDFKLYRQLSSDCVSQRYGTPAASRFNEKSQKWESVLNCDSEYEKVNEATGDWGLKSISHAEVSAKPIAYYSTGHASVATQDILVIHKDIAYQLRLPSINGFDHQREPGRFEKLVAEQRVLLPDIIKTIRFTE
jgi:hypothetical protein